MKSNYTHISILLDTSGSTESIKNDIIGGYNSFIEKQKQESGELTVTQALFDDRYEIIYNKKNIQEIEPLTDKTFIPRGWTALLRAAVRLIDDTGKVLAALPEEERPEKVLFLIITDGLENWSNSCKFADEPTHLSNLVYTKQLLAEKIKHQEEVYKWEFVYLGANQDAFSEGGSMGVSKSFNYTATADGVDKSFKAFTKSFTKYRSNVGGACASGFEMSQEDIDNEETDKK